MKLVLTCTFYAHLMHDQEASGPDPESITRYILDTFPGVDLLEAGGASFFSLDPDRHFPNFATIVTNDDYDEGSDLSRPGVFRLNIGVGRATFQRLVGRAVAPDYSVIDRVIPHPTYARQLWVAILNPSDVTFEEIVRPLLAEAYERLAAQQARHARSGGFDG